MKQRKTLNTRYKILQCATMLFLEKGYTEAYVTTIANTLQISTGNLTFWFPTKEHILAELIKELCVFQERMDEKESEEDYSLITSYLFELAMFASVCMENPNIKDLVVAAYTHPLSLGIIRANDTERAKKIFGKFCPEWTETEFIQTENVVSGIEYAMFMTENAEMLSFEQRVTSSMDAIMRMYEVPKEIRQSIIAEVMTKDYRSKGNQVFEEFCNYVGDKNTEELQRTAK